MLPKKAERQKVLNVLHEVGGLREGSVSQVHQQTGVPAADVYGVATFYHLLSDPETDVFVCQGLSCRLKDHRGRLNSLLATGKKARCVSCLGRCDHAPAVWDRREPTPIGPSHFAASSEAHAIDLLAPDAESYGALTTARAKGGEWVCEQLEASGIQGRGGAGFPAHIKWRAVRSQPVRERYVVLNADEGEPGTFKDREVILRRPHLVVEGLAIAAFALEAQDIYCYVRGEFGVVRETLETAVGQARQRGELDSDVRWHFVDGHGAYICGEETALLEALEGRRGMPRMKPPFPVEKGLFGRPTLIQNVETIACLSAILSRGGEWFAQAGRTAPGSKLYCLSGHVVRPGVYEAPLGISMRELIDMAGGVEGDLQAFSPGGASSGFLPASMIDVAMDFRSLQEAGSMLGSAGAVVLNQTVDMAEAALVQAVFFEDESCGQCSPCRIGTRMLRVALEAYLANGRDVSVLSHLGEVAWGMGEASICGLGQAAALPLTTAMKHFPEAFGVENRGF